MREKLYASAVAAVMSLSAANVYSDAFSVSAAAAAGDVNGDGVFSVADVLLFQKWLTADDSAVLTDESAADLNSDGETDVFDLILMKKRLVSMPVTADYSALKINEICASNTKDSSDNFIAPDGSRPDWTELYNSSDAELDISGVGLSDDKDEPYKYVFPDGTVIAPHGFILVMCDSGKPEDASYAPFSISKSKKETIRITAPKNPDGTDGELIEKVKLPELDNNISYGRITDGDGDFQLLTVTPDASNESAGFAVSSPVFDREGGFYDDAFELSLSGSSSDEIYYTKDGSDPRTSPTAVKYTSPINIYDNTPDMNELSRRTDITVESYYKYGSTGYRTPYAAPSYHVDKGIIIRAVCKNESGSYGKVITNGYYIGKDDIGISGVKYKDMRVISIATDYDNLFDKDDGIYVVGNIFDGVTYVYPNDTRHMTNYNLTAGCLGLPYTEEQIEKPCSVQVYENGELAYSENAGLRIGGNWSRGFAQKTLKLYARSKYGAKKFSYDFFDGLTDANGNPVKEFDKLVLHNGGSDHSQLHYRDELVQKLCSGNDSISTIAAEPCVVFLDGEFWGFYFLRQNFGESSIEEIYGVDADDVTMLEDGYYSGDDAQVQDDMDSFLDWALTADMRKDENIQRVADTIDIDSFISYIAIQTYICNADWSKEDNYYNWKMWRSNTIDADNPYSDGKWRFAVYDTDQGLAAWGLTGNTTGYDYNHLDHMYHKATRYNTCYIFYNMLNNESFRHYFQEEYKRICDDCFFSTDAVGMLNTFNEEYSGLIEETCRRFGTNFGSYTNAVNNVAAFFKNRRSYAFGYLDDMIAKYDAAASGDKPVTDLMDNAKSCSYWVDTESGAQGNLTVLSANSHRFTTTALGQYRSSLQASYANILLDRNKTYEIRFTAYSNVEDSTIRVHFQHPTTYERAFEHELTLSRTPQEYVIPVTSLKDVGADALVLLFSYGYNTGTFTVSDISIVET